MVFFFFLEKMENKHALWVANTRSGSLWHRERLLTCRETASPAVVVSQTRVSSRDPVLTAGRDAVNRRAEGAFASGWNDQEEDRWPALDGGHVGVAPR